MSELFEKHRERMTERERAEVWARIEEKAGRAGGRRAPWRRPAMVGAFVVAFIAAIIGLQHLVGSRQAGRFDLAVNLERSKEGAMTDAVTDGGAPAAPSVPAPFARTAPTERERDMKGDAPVRTQESVEQPLEMAQRQRPYAEPDGNGSESRTEVAAEPKAKTLAAEEKIAMALPPVEVRAPQDKDMESSVSSSSVDVKYEFKHRSINTVSDALSKEAGGVEQDGQKYVRSGRGNETKYFVDRAPSAAANQPEGRGADAEKNASRSGAAGSQPDVESEARLRAMGYLDPGTSTNRTGGGVSGVKGLNDGPRRDETTSWGKVQGIYGGSAPPNDETYDAMFFQNYGVNPLIPTDEDSLSTFAVDVDAASYTVARRYIEGGALPPKDAVRVEEFVNFFRQDYPAVTDGDFRIHLDGAPTPFAEGYHLIRIGIQGRRIPSAERKPASLVFVIDVSGSMARDDRLGLVKSALRLLVDELNADDAIGIVAFGSSAQILLEPTPLEDRGAIQGAIDRLQPGGSTNAEAGLGLGYDMARRFFRRGAINRIVLCSDGVANVGATAAGSILESARREADRGISLTTIGFGMGNYNDVLMEQLADKGDGNYFYVDDLAEARRVFFEKLTGTIQTIARDAKVQVAFDPKVVMRYRLLGFENRDVVDSDFRNDAVDAGEIGAGHEVTALYEVKLAPDAAFAGRVATVRLRYATPERERGGDQDIREVAASLDASRLARRFADASPRFRLDAVAGEFAEILRQSYWAKGSRVSDLAPLARRLSDDLLHDPAVAELERLIDRATTLSAPASNTAAEDR